MLRLKEYISFFHTFYFRRGRSSSSMKVFGGDYARSDDSFIYQFRDVAEIHEHPQYGRSTDGNDIALLKLSYPFVINDYIKPICLSEDNVLPGTECIASGWETTSK